MINMVLGPPDNATMILIPGHLNMEQELDMAIFHITNWNLVSKTNGKGLEMSITMRRKINGELMTTFFPSLLLTAITFATTFFKPFFFEAALSVNLTTMLVMTTIFISKMEGLPPTSDIKMIDIWLVLCQMVPFAEVILLTAMEYKREDKKKGKKKKKPKKVQTTSLTVAPMEKIQAIDEDKTGPCSFDCSFPSLKTIGEFFCFCLITIHEEICLHHTAPHKHLNGQLGTRVRQSRLLIY